ncbi:MAG TPA: BatD family protein [Puia sp.]|nr:BatD family protein [Puia sp.]
MILVIMFTGLFASGQVKFNTVVSSQDIGRSDYLQVEFVIENARQIDQMTPPDFQGFQVVQGPIQSSGMSIVNGNMSQYKSLSFVLQPVKTGKFIIGGASATVDGKHMRSNSVTVTVSGSSSSSGAGGGNTRPINPFPSINWPPDPMGPPEDVDRDIVLKPGENVKDKIRKNLFLKVQVDKTSCYVGEPIVATYKLYSRLSSESRVTKRPSLNGFSVYDMVDPTTDVPSVERLNGKAYTVHTIRKTQLIPLQAGTIDLDPVEVENTVHFVKGTKQQERHSSGNALRDFFDQMSDDDNMGPEIDENVTLDTKPVSITIKPLPEENKPANFNGAVGSFTIQASLTNRNISAEDEATLHVVIRGKGNLPVINAPQVAWPSSVDAYDPVAKEDINKTVAPMTGSKSFDFHFVPRDAGHYTIPAITLPYFDPASQSYKTAGTEPLDFQVMASTKKKSAPSTVARRPAAEESNGRLKKLIQDHLEWIFAVLILSFVAIYLWRQNRRLKRTEQEQKEAAAKKEAEELLAEKARQAMAASVQMAVTPVADPLLEVRQLFEQGDYKGFYRELNRAVWKALSKKLELPASELNKHNIALQLELKGWDKEHILSLESILNECEMNLYTPAYDTYNMQLLLRQAEPVMNRLA